MRPTKESTVNKYLEFLQALYVSGAKNSSKIKIMAQNAGVTQAIGTHLKTLGVINEDGQWVDENKKPSRAMVVELLEVINKYHAAYRKKRRQQSGAERGADYKILAALFALREVYKMGNKRPVLEVIKGLRMRRGFDIALFEAGILSMSNGEYLWVSSEMPSFEMVKQIKNLMANKGKKVKEPGKQNMSEYAEILNNLKELNAKFDAFLKLWS